MGINCPPSIFRGLGGNNSLAWAGAGGLGPVETGRRCSRKVPSNFHYFFRLFCMFFLLFWLFCMFILYVFCMYGGVINLNAGMGRGEQRQTFALLFTPLVYIHTDLSIVLRWRRGYRSCFKGRLHGFFDKELYFHDEYVKDYKIN